MKLQKFTYFLFLILLIIPTIAVGEDIASDNPLKIDRHWIYIFQQDDLNSFEVNEYFYVNNTGITSYNKSLGIWVQNNSYIEAGCCNFTPNFACRYDQTGKSNCFSLNNSIDNENEFIGYPFSNEDLLSYYGQIEQISIDAYSISNPTLDSSNLLLNATIGGMSIPRKKNTSDNPIIYLTSKNSNIGINSILDPYMPFKINVTENITLENNGDEHEVIGFNFSHLPFGWSAEIWNDTSIINNISLIPKNHTNLTLKISTPSNIASIHIRYIIQFENIENKNTGIYKKKYLYDTDKLTYEAYLIYTKDVKISDDLAMVHNEFFWLEEYARHWFNTRSENVQQGSSSTIVLNIEKSTDNSIFYQISLLIIILIFIVVFLILKKKNFFEDGKSPENKKITSKKSEEKLLEEKKKIEELIKRTKMDQKLKLIDEKTAKSMILDYQQQIDNLNLKINDFEKNKTKNKFIKEKDSKIKELEEQKKKIYTAIKKIEREFKEKTISKEDYERFRAAYKKQAVEILKEIDKVKK